MFGWSARPEVHWIVPIIGSAFFSMGAALLFNSVLNYLPDAYPADAASVLAGNGMGNPGFQLCWKKRTNAYFHTDLMRSAFGAGFPLFARVRL